MNVSSKLRNVVRTLGLVLLTHVVSAGTAQEDRARWQREDIAVFRERFLSIDRSFNPVAKAEALRRLDRLEGLNGAVDPSAFVVELCRITALADNGHTLCLTNSAARDFCQRLVGAIAADSAWCNARAPDFEVADFNRLAIEFYPFGDGFYVIGVDEEYSSLLGARLLTVDGRPVDAIRNALRSFAGGTLAHRDLAAADVLSSPEQLHAVGLSDRADIVDLEFAHVWGEKKPQRLVVTPSSSARGKWQQLPPADKAPWAFQEPEKPFRYQDAPDLDAVIVQLRQIADMADQKISEFLEKTEQRRAILGRRNVVLDMRFNGGGNLYLTRDFMRRWPERIEGKFYVLTSRRTFSAAITSIAYLKQAGNDRVVIVGEPVGDRLMFFSDGLPIRLPHSGRYFLPAVVRMDYQGGCRKYDDCLEAIAPPGRQVAQAPLQGPPHIERLALSVDTLDPDIPAPWTIDSWLKGHDPMMNAVRNYAERNGK